MPNTEPVALPDSAREHLRAIGRVLPDDITEVTTCQWRWLFDLRRGLFTRRPRSESLDRTLEFGAWRELQHVRVLEGGRLEVKEWARPAIRTSLHGAACGCSTPST